METMIKYVVFYDMTGKIYLVQSVDETPSGLEKFTFDVPENSQITGVDLTDPNNPQIIYEEAPTPVDVNKELEDLQEAVVELYEMIAPQQEV
jgi:hypothetical protein